MENVDEFRQKYRMIFISTVVPFKILLFTRHNNVALPELFSRFQIPFFSLVHTFCLSLTLLVSQFLGYSTGYILHGFKLVPCRL